MVSYRGDIVVVVVVVAVDIVVAEPGQSESSTRCLDVCKYQMLSNSRRVLWLTLGTSCLQSIQYKFHNKNKTLLAFYTHCMYFYNLYVYWNAIPNLPDSAPKLGPH